jgi:hypothetical protein
MHTTVLCMNVPTVLVSYMYDMGLTNHVDHQ